MPGEVRALGKILADQAIGVFVCAAWHPLTGDRPVITPYLATKAAVTLKAQRNARETLVVIDASCCPVYRRCSVAALPVTGSMRGMAPYIPNVPGAVLRFAPGRSGVRS